MGKGGGGQGNQTTSTSYNTNIPQYAQPYVENMLGATQRQLFNTRDVAGTPGTRTQTGTDENGNAIYSTTEATPGYTELTGFKPYQPYSSNPSDYVAGFSSLQNQGFNDLANMNVAQQIGMGTDIANQASQGAMGTANPAMGYGAQGSQAGQAGQGIGVSGGLGYGAQGYGIGQQGMQAGMSYGQNAQNPNAVQGYMNPYLQASLQPQLQEMQRQYGISGAQQQSNATRAGAFGGSREALAFSENQRNKNLAMNQVIGQGYNNAYNLANQNMQAASQLGMQGAGIGLQGVNAGLQGVNTALAGTAQGMQGAQTGLAGIQGAQNAYGLGIQGANALGNLGAAQYNQQMGIAQARLGAGAQQQQYQQQIINQAVQDYANAQQYPLMQLGTMSNMLRGLPMQAQTTNQYMAAPNPVTQGVGAAGSLAYMNSAMQPKTAAKGGIMQAFDVGGEVRANLENMSLQQLQQYMSQSSSPEVKRMAQELIREKTMEQQFQKQQQPQQYAKGGITEVQRFNDGELVTQAAEDRKFINNLFNTAKANISDYNPFTLGTTAVKKYVDIPLSNFVTRGINAFGGNIPLKKDISLTPETDALAARQAAEASARPKPELRGLTGTGELGLKNIDSGETVSFNPKTKSIDVTPRQPGEGIKIPEYASPATVARALNSDSTEEPSISQPSAVPSVGGGGGNGGGGGTGVGGGSTMSDLEKLIGPRETLKSTKEYLAERKGLKDELGIGENYGAQQALREAQAERANAGDEAERQRKMRVAEFFASWGSRPGSTLVAGLQAMKETIPNLITDDREQRKALREINSNIALIQDAIRKEKLGDLDSATAEKEKAAGRIEKFNEKLVAYQMAKERNAATSAAASQKTTMTPYQKQQILAKARLNQTSASRNADVAFKSPEYKEAVLVLSRPMPKDAPDVLVDQRRKAQDIVDHIQAEVAARRQEAAEEVAAVRAELGLSPISEGSNSYSSINNKIDIGGGFSGFKIK